MIAEEIHPDDSGNTRALELEGHGIQQVDLDKGDHGVCIAIKRGTTTK